MSDLDQTVALQTFYTLIKQLSDQPFLQVDEVKTDIFQLKPNQAKGDVYALLAITHGNEWAGVGIFNGFIKQLLETKTLNNEVYLILANKPAYLENKRFIEKDLNRVYGHIDTPTCLEEHRVAEIRDVLDRCDVSLDFHQTVEPTHHPFFIFPYQLKTYQWAKQLITNMPIVTNPKQLKPTTSSSYMVFQNKIGITVEVGDSGFSPDQISLGLYVINQALDLPQTQVEPQIHKHQKMLFSIDFHKKNHQDTVSFRPDLKHFDFVKQAQVIGKINGQDLTCEHEGYILLYPPVMINDIEHPSDGIYIILKSIEEKDLSQWQ